MSSGRTAATRSDAPTAMTMSGTPALAPTSRARRRSPWSVPSTPSSTDAPATPPACSAATTASYAGRPPARSCRPTKTVSLTSGAGSGSGSGVRPPRLAPIATEEPHPLEREQPRHAERRDLRVDGLDPLPLVDRHRDQRQVLGQREQPVRPHPAPPPEALHAPQQQAHRHLVAREDLRDRVGEEAVARPRPLAQVRRELARVPTHNAAPSSRPAQASPTPSTRLTPKLSAPSRSWPSSPNRCDSSAHVENVVYAPSSPVPATS